MNYSVDVVIPVYNGAQYILQALSSVMGQDCPPKNIIVVDDGSTDTTSDLVMNLVSPIPVRYVYQENGGLSSARNTGIRLCTSEYIAFLDADDEWYPHKLSSQLELFRKSDRENLGAVYCGYEVIDEESRISDEHFIVEPDPLNRGYIFDRLLEANSISSSGSGILLKSECLLRVGTFDEKLKACEDWDMWLRIAAHYEFDYVPESLVRIRRHSHNMQKCSNFMYSNILVFYDKWSDAALRHGCDSAWSKAIVNKILWDLPDLRSFYLARNLLSREAKDHLFHGAFDSLLRFLLSHAPAIVIIGAKRLLRWEDRA